MTPALALYVPLKLELKAIKLALITFHSILVSYRHTSQGAGQLQPPGSGKAITFQAEAKLFRQKPAAKNEKMVLIKQKNEIHSV